mgnify:CR=1 FL=1
MDHAVRDASADFIESLCAEYQKHNQIDPAFYERYRVKRGLRNADGTGVMAGVTQIGNVMGYYVQDGERIPAPGKLVYRGIDVEELINGFVSEGRFGFEETAYLLLFGALPTRAQLTAFEGLLSAHRALPPMFTVDMILKAPSPDVMNKLARSVLALYSYDGRPDDMSLPNQLRQAVELIARVPVIVAHAFAAKRHYYDNESLYFHRPQEGLSVAQNFLYSVRHDNRYTDEEARLLDLCLVLHAEHGGGNNSAFACRVLSSSGTDIYSSIAALLCVQPYAEDTKRMAIQRIVGTAIGSVFGIATLLLEMALDIQGTLVGYIVIAAVTVPNLWIAVVLKSSNAAALSGIVFLSITVTHVTDASPWIFAWYRASETLVGIAVGIAVNAFQLPRRKRRDVLFVSGLDGLLLTEQGTLTPYSRVSLNRMLDDGMQFTLSTMRTPASVREATRDLRLRLPVIVMDGAALYDMEKKRYLHACVLPRELALRCEAVFRAQGIHCFLNGVLDDNLMIYYGEFHHETERAIFEKLRTSPYRNYVSRSYYKDCPIVYLMGIDLTERMQALYDALGEAGLLEQVKVRFYPAAEYPGYSYLKIYERSASREAMLERLKQDLGMERSVVLTTQEGCGDVVIRGGANQAVKRLGRLFEPYLWEQK